MKLVCISDTHGQHRKLKLPEGDVLIHGGDISNGGVEEVQDFLAWLGALPYSHKIFIGGNMDYPLARNPEFIRSQLPPHTYYLEDEGISIEGKTFWGSPWIPHFVGVFMKNRGEEIDERWSKIPLDLDVLITHTPPKGILDTTSRGNKVGCEALAERLPVLSPKFHIFGHVHEAFGTYQEEQTRFYNVAFLNRKGFNPPVEILL